MTRITCFLAAVRRSLRRAAADRSAAAVGACPGVQPGLWEISGAAGHEGADPAVRRRRGCARREFEHRGADAARARSSATTAARRSIEYSCGAAGFGRSEVDVHHAALAADRDAGHLRAAAVQLCAAGAPGRRLRSTSTPLTPLRPRLTMSGVMESRAGFGTLSSQSGSDARYLGRPSSGSGGPSFVPHRDA